MANEAVIIELGHAGGRPIRYTLRDDLAVTKGALLSLIDPYSVSNSSAAGEKFAGIAAMDKEANDGTTEITAYTQGIFDLRVAGWNLTAGDFVELSGANVVRGVISTSPFSGGTWVGKSMESTALATPETVRVAVGYF